MRCFKFARDLSGKTTFRARADPFAQNWVDLNGVVDGHIPLARKPLTFANVFGPTVSLGSLQYIARKVKNVESIAKMQQNVRYSCYDFFVFNFVFVHVCYLHYVILYRKNNNNMFVSKC